MPIILCVDDDRAATTQLEVELRQLGHEPVLTSRIHTAREALARRSFDLVISTLRLPDGTGLELLDEIGESATPAPVLMMAPYQDTAEALDALRRGAIDFITKPIRTETLRLSVQLAIENGRLRRENHDYRQRVSFLQGPPPIIGRSVELRRVLEMVDSVAPTRATVLLEGESGVGKELFARAIHEKSPRRDRPMVTLRCAALSPAMLEVALFGQEASPFGGRPGPREGAFERADQGTLLLDEITEMSLPLQGRLLRTLQQQEFERSPGARPVRVDVRLIATTRRDLRERVAAGSFRRDLYYRLSVVTIHAPALRERPEDLPLLVSHFAETAATELGIRTPSIPEETLDRLRRHSWPGNVHELANAVERAVILSRDGVLTPGAFDLRGALPSTEPTAGSAVAPQVFDLETLKFDALQRALLATAGRRAKAAKLLGISERTLRNMLQRVKGRKTSEPSLGGDDDRPGPPAELR
jgi:DNA-binding NtrC family response regulator